MISIVAVLLIRGAKVGRFFTTDIQLTGELNDFSSFSSFVALPICAKACQEQHLCKRNIGLRLILRATRMFHPKKRKMEIVILEKKTFEYLLSNVQRLTEEVDSLARRCNDKRLEKWMDSRQVCETLRIGERTLQTLRSKRLIAYTRIGRRFYYHPQEVERVLSLGSLYVKEGRA